jgi:hypothetical protein
MYLRKILFIVALSAGLFACSQEAASYDTQSAPQEAEEYAAKSYDEDQMPPPESQTPSAPPSEMPERVLLRTAECRMEVVKINERVKAIERLVEQKAGYLGDLNWQHYSHQEQVSMNLRVPATDFQWVLDSIMKMAVEVNYQQVSTQDVTEEYVDVQSRLKTKKAVRDRYEEILRTKAKTVEEILLAEEQIRRLQEEIESQEGRLRYLSQRAAMSTIQLELYETLEEQAANPWWQRFGGEIGDSLSFSVAIVKNLFLGLLSIWPLLLLAGLLIWHRKAIWKRFRS